MIMVIWSWLWSENDHDQRTPIMGAVCCVWSLIRAQKQLRLNSQLQIAKACGNPSIAISERVLKPQPALWSSELILTTGTFLWPDPVLRDNNQFWIHTKSRSGSNFRTSSDHLGEELQEKMETFLFLWRQKMQIYIFWFGRNQKVKFCQQTVATLKPGCEASNQAKPEQMCDKDRALENVTCDMLITCDICHMWHHTDHMWHIWQPTVWQEEWQPTWRFW